MRVRVEYEAEANYTNGHWVVWYRDVYNNTDTTLLPSTWVTPISAPEPTKSGLYKLTWEDNIKDVAYFNGQHWHRTGDATKYTWKDLENVVAVERIDL